MRFATGFAALALLVTTQPSIADDQKSLRACAKAAAYGPLKKGITIAGHDFNCHHIRAAKDAEITAAGKKADTYNRFYMGQLSHALRLRPDDQVQYLIHLKYMGGGKCDLLPPTIKINRGGFVNLIKPLATELHLFKEEDWRSLAKKLEGDWEATANLVVAESVTKWAEQFPDCTKRYW